MHYLIDGHNLIGQLTDIDLADPDDEAKLVLRLRQWIASGRKREVTVIFDHGLPAGRWRAMSNKHLKAIFASQDNSADELLIGRINKVQDPKAYTLISSDQQVLQAAKKRRMPYMDAETFGKQLDKAEPPLNELQEQDISGGKPDDLTEEEIAEWLSIFDDSKFKEPELSDLKKNHNAKQSRQEDGGEKTIKAGSTPLSNNEPTILKGGERTLSSTEVDEWLEIFGESGEN